MGFNATLNNISVISSQSVLLVEETGVPDWRKPLTKVTDKLYHIMLRKYGKEKKATSTIVRRCC
jgi:hypothetical protein